MTAFKTVFITGATSGIGAGLAAAFHQRGARVILGGRDEARLREVAARLAGAETCVVDVANDASVEACAAELTRRHADLDTVINNAGIQRLISFTGTVELRALQAEVATNFTGLMSVSAAFLPALLRQPAATLVHVGSGLGFVPLVAAPVYSATKAAVHSFTVSLREQLKGTHVRVVELIPPAVETALHRDQPRRPPRAMPLDRFIDATMKGLLAGDEEIAVGLAKVLRLGARVAPRGFLKIVNR